MIKYEESIPLINERRGDAVAIYTMTQGRAWTNASQRPDLDVGISNGMSKASSLGLGIALGRPDRQVIVLDGDGSILMNLGSLVTVAGMAPRNFIHFVFDNGMYAVTGGQPVPNMHRTDYRGMALAAGYRSAYEFDNVEDLATELPRIMAEPGPTLVNLKTTPEPADEGVDQTWESNARMPRQMRNVMAALEAEPAGN